MLHPSKIRLLRALSPAQQRRLALGVGILCVAVLTPALFLSFPKTKSLTEAEQERRCPCHDVERAERELADYKANITREDAEASLKGPAMVGPLQRTVYRQRGIIEDQEKELRMLREAARARELLLSADALRRKEYEKFVIRDDDPRLWQQRTFRKHAAFGFVAYSAYRLSPSLIIVPGIGSLRGRDKRRLQSCHWVSDSGERTEGRLGLEYMNEHHYFLYELLLLNCTLPEPSTKEGDPKAPSNMYSSKEGGYLEVVMDQEVFYPYVEKEGFQIHKGDSSGPFRWENVFCGPPMFGDLSLPGILQWVAYHRYHAGFEHFYLYDSGAFSPDFLMAFNPLIDEGVVTVQDFREGLQYDVWAQNQALAMHDCLFRTRETARWVWFHDLDEYLEAPPTATVPQILHKYRDQAWLTHGSYHYSMDKCEEKDVWSTRHDKYAVEMMLYRWERPYCIKGDTDPALCTDYYGMRKVVANPRKVLRTYIHHTSIPSDNGVDLHISELWHSHFKRLIQPARACSKDPEQSDALKRVTSLAEIAAKARECAREGFTNKARCRPGQEA